MKHTIQSLSKRILLVLLVWFAVHSSYITLDGLGQPQRTADVALVLGTTVTDDGEPSPWLLARLQRGVQLYQQGQVKNVLVSGGVGDNGIHEAQVMKHYLLAQGIPAEHIWVDEQGNDTGLSAKHTAALMREQEWYNVIVVSQFFHLTRAKLLLQQAGVSEVESASSRIVSVWELVPLWREWPAYYAYALGAK